MKMNLAQSIDSWGSKILAATLPESARRKIEAFLDSISDSRLLVWDIKTVLFILACVGIFTVFVALDYSGSSNEKWDQYIVDSTQISNNQPLLGTAKWIRFDEWCLGTPCLRSQYLHNFEMNNPAVGYGHSSLLMGTPVNDITSYVKPQLWGFYLFSFERGLSFFWYYKYFGMLVTFFLLLKILSKNNFWMSVAGSLWLLYSSYIQWWFSTPGTELIICASMIIICGLYVFISRNSLAIIVCSLLLSLFSVAFVLTLYPPYQVSMGYFILAVFGGMLWKTASKELLLDKLYLRIAGAAFVLVVVGVLTQHFLALSKDSISIMAATEYPGNRISTGGVISMSKYWGGFFDFIYSETHLPAIWGNPCEASSFILLYPIIVVALAIDVWKKRNIDGFTIVLIVYILFVTLWMLTGYPEFIAKITALNRVRENRATIGIGVANIALIVRYLSGDRKLKEVRSDGTQADGGSGKSNKKKKSESSSKRASTVSSVGSNLFSLETLVIVVLSFAGIYWFGSYFNAENANFFATRQIVIVGIVVAVMGGLILAHARFVFMTLVVGFVLWTNFLINPLTKGMPALTEKPLMKALTEIRSSDPQAKWIAYGSNILANYLIAAGVDVVNGTKFIPDLAMLKIIDPTGANMKVYNRFAHIHCLSFNPDSKDPDAIKLILDNDDAYTLCIDPMSKQLNDIGVTYIMSNRTLSKGALAKWTPLYDDAINGMYLYKRRTSTVNDSELLYSKMRVLPIAQFRVENLRMAANTAHDRFIVTGWAYDLAEDCVPSAVYADVNGYPVEGHFGFDDPSAPEEKFRKGGFRIEIPYTRLGTGQTEFHIQVMNKDKSGYATGTTPLGVTLN